MTGLVQCCDNLVNDLFQWVPPWRSGMPGLFKFFVLFGFLWGAGSLASAILGRVLIISDPHVLWFPGGRVVMAAWGALALLQAALLLSRRRFGLYAFWGFHAYCFLVIALYGLLAIRRELSSGGMSLEELLSSYRVLLLVAAVSPALCALYGWYHRNWFLTGGRAQEGPGPSATIAEKTHTGK